MVLTEMICALGVGFLAPERCAPQMVVQLMETSCNKHEQDAPTTMAKAPHAREMTAMVVSGKSGTGIEQPCKAVVGPAPSVP